MPINLSEIRQAVQDYLNNNVTVTLSSFTPTTGTSIQPNEKFKFTVTARNANSANGGVALKNVRYLVQSSNGAVAGIDRTISGASTTTLTGNPFPAGTPEFVPALIALSGLDSTLDVGDVDMFEFVGLAGTAPAGGEATIRARVLADVDVDRLFPKNEDTPSVSSTIHVEG